MKLADELKSLMPSQKAIALKNIIIEKLKEFAAKDMSECRLSSIFSALDKEWNDSVYYVYRNGEAAWKKDNVVGKIFAELEKEGISTRFFYEERQFVDMDIIISWK